MEELLRYAAGAGGGAIVVVVAYLKILAARLDTLQDSVDQVGRKVDKLDAAVMDHEVRIRVMERTSSQEEL